MQNKGFVKIFAVLLTLVCLFYLSFSFATRYYTSKAEAMSKEAGMLYLDSLKNEKVWLGAYTFKQCQEMQIGLGLDLKGGMNVILEVSVPDVVKSLADHSEDANFTKAVAEAATESVNSQSDFITLFVKNFQAKAGKNRLAEIFATQQLKGKITTRSSDADVEKTLRAEVKAAVDNSYNVLRTRIDRFGVAQPNIQNLEGQMGRIMVEMPGIKEPERVRKLLQGSANLEFWETYDGTVIVPYLASLDSKFVTAAKGDKATTDTTATATDTTKVEKKTTEKANLTAALKGGKGKASQAANAKTDEQARKEHPLMSILQFTQGQ
ncbi:MAG: protein translocase subunit SecDF, partial [Bacteroidaceae bacterium]